MRDPNRTQEFWPSGWAVLALGLGAGKVDMSDYVWSCADRAETAQKRGEGGDLDRPCRAGRVQEKGKGIGHSRRGREDSEHIWGTAQS